MRIDTRSTRERVLALLCAGFSRDDVRRTVATELGEPVGSAELARVCRSVADGRERLLVPGKYRRATAKRREVHA